MSEYTTQLRWFVEMHSSTGKPITERIKEALPSIFDFSYPIFDIEYATILETNIIRHYYMDEIAHETFQLWKLRLEDKMNLIMPKYNGIYIVQNKIDKPLMNVYYDSKTTNDRTRTPDLTRTNDLTATSKDNDLTDVFTKFYETPTTDIDSINDYLNSAQSNKNNYKGENTSKNTGTVKDTGTEKNLDKEDKNMSGFMGKSQSELYEQYKKVYESIDALVIKELEPLFMGLW